MMPYKRHLISKDLSLKDALIQLNTLGADAILFVVDGDSLLIGSLTDGDVRRGFLKGLTFTNLITEFIQPDPKFIQKGKYSISQVTDFRERNFKVIPVVDEHRRIVNIINFRYLKSYLPVDAVIMAGGRGERLRPLTDEMPKPMLLVGDKPIIEFNIDRLSSFGVDDFWLSLRYLSEKIENHFGDGSRKNIKVKYVREKEPLGTIGALSMIDQFLHDHILVMNSDILTNLDFEEFFLSYLESKADFSVVTIPYEVSVPYAVLETSNGHVVSFKEKPTYTYYSNGGIYLMKRSIAEAIPKHKFYNATDTMAQLIQEGKKVHSYPLHGYWLDIGRMEDYQKALKDINHIKF
jgi:dTDP-glucose pyrophosphorylase